MAYKKRMAAVMGDDSIKKVTIKQSGKLLVKIDEINNMVINKEK